MNINYVSGYLTQIKKCAFLVAKKWLLLILLKYTNDLEQFLKKYKPKISGKY